MIVAGIGSRKGVSAEEVLAAIHAALSSHDLAVEALTALATTGFKRQEAGISSAAERLGVPMMVVATAEDERPSSPPGTGEEVVSEVNRSGGLAAPRTPTPSRPSTSSGLDTSPPLGEEGRRDELAVLTRSVSSQKVAGVASVSETAALAAAGPGGRLLGPRIAVGRVTCAVAIGEERP